MIYKNADYHSSKCENEITLHYNQIDTLQNN